VITLEEIREYAPRFIQSVRDFCEDMKFATPELSTEKDRNNLFDQLKYVEKQYDINDLESLMKSGTFIVAVATYIICWKQTGRFVDYSTSAAALSMFEEIVRLRESSTPKIDLFKLLNIDPTAIPSAERCELSNETEVSAAIEIIQKHMSQIKNVSEFMSYDEFFESVLPLAKQANREMTEKELFGTYDDEKLACLMIQIGYGFPGFEPIYKEPGFKSRIVADAPVYKQLQEHILTITGKFNHDPMKPPEVDD
jgi:hypothetical protein